jgi:lambda family phage tail tape measure protein
VAYNYQAAVTINGEYNAKQAIQSAAKDLKGLSGVAQGLGSALKALGVAYVVKQQIDMIKATIDLGDHLNDLRQKTGIGVQTLTAFKAAAEDSGMEMGQLEGALRKFSVTVAGANAGNELAVHAFKKLKLEIQDTHGKLKPTGELILEVADKFKKMADGPQKAALAVKLFGRSGADMIPMLNLGRAAIEDLGLQISDDFALRADHFNDTLNAIKRNMEQTKIAAATGLMPALQELADSFNSLSKPTKDSSAAWENVGEVLRQLGVIALGAAGAVATFWSILNTPPRGGDASGPVKVFNSYIDRIKELEKHSNLFGDGKSREATKPSEVAKGKSTADFGDDEATGRAKKELDAIKNLRIELKELNALRELEAQKNSLSSLEFKNREAAIKGASKAERESKDFTSAHSKEYQELTKQVTAAKQATNALAQAQKESFGEGAKSAFKNYLEGAKDVAGQSKKLFESAFNGIEDSLVKWAQGAKLSFSDLAKSIEGDLIRIAIKQAIIQPLMNGAKALFGFADGGIMTSGGPMPLRKYAGGGVADSPQLAMFGEGSKPEAYVPLPDGRNIPVKLEGGMGGGSTSVVVNVSVAGDGSSQTDAAGSEKGKELGKLVANVVKSTIINEKRPGGLLANA